MKYDIKDLKYATEVTSLKSQLWVAMGVDFFRFWLGDIVKISDDFGDEFVGELVWFKCCFCVKVDDIKMIPLT